MEKLRYIQKIAQDYCNACKEFEPEKSEDKTTCLYCNYRKILKVINDQKERLPNKHKQALKEIEKLVIRPDGYASKKYFLPNNWEKINKKSVNYHFWKRIAEGKD